MLRYGDKQFRSSYLCAIANLAPLGLPNKEIALKLAITEHTVSNYLFNIYNKLGISSRVGLVLYVLKQREQHAAGAAG